MTAIANDLGSKVCIPGRPRLTEDAVTDYLGMCPEWELSKHGHLTRKLTFPDFASALAFVNRVGHIAESNNHHPSLTLGWGRVEIELWTHDAGGLTENDFILAAKIEALGREGPG